jgi:predicted esterase
MARKKLEDFGRKDPFEGRLSSRSSQVLGAASLGLQPLKLGGDRDGLLYVPIGYQVSHPAPLILMLHGAGGNARQGIVPLQAIADELGLILLSIDSRRQTWDVIMSEYGDDIEFIDIALTKTFNHYAIDQSHIAIEGFSDGASYALSVGITNGDLFTHIIAFSPGFMAPVDQQGLPRIFVSHGASDSVLPIDRCSRKIVSQLEQAGYDVTYEEFDGSHTIPTSIARDAVNWFTEDLQF